LNIRSGIVYTVAGSAIPVGVTLVILPAYLALIGTDRFGCVSLLWLILGYFTLSDLGVGRAITQKLASAHSSDKEEMSSWIWSAVFTVSLTGVAGGLVAWACSVYFFFHVFDVDPALLEEIGPALVVLLPLVPVTLLGSILTCVLRGYEKFFLSSASAALGSSLFLLFPFLTAAAIGPELHLIALAVLASRLTLLLFVVAMVVSSGIAVGCPSVSLAKVTGLLAYGRWVLVSSTLGPAMRLADRFAIGAFLGAQAVASYAIPFALINRLGLLPGSVIQVVFPTLSRSRATDGWVVISTLRALGFGITIVVSIGLLGVSRFLTWWVGPSLARDIITIARVLLVGFWAHALGRLPAAQLQASGRPQLLAWLNFIQAIPYVVILCLGINIYGLIGAAMVWTGNAVVETLVLFKMIRLPRPEWIRLCVVGVSIGFLAAGMSFYQAEGGHGGIRAGANWAIGLAGGSIVLWLIWQLPSMWALLFFFKYRAKTV